MTSRIAAILLIVALASAALAQTRPSQPFRITSNDPTFLDRRVDEIYKRILAYVDTLHGIVSDTARIAFTRSLPLVQGGVAHISNLGANATDSALITFSSSFGDTAYFVAAGLLRQGAFRWGSGNSTLVLSGGFRKESVNSVWVYAMYNDSGDVSVVAVGNR